MATRLAVLTLALGLALAGGSAARPGAGRASCGDCHRPHAETRQACTACHGGNAGTSRRGLAHERLLRGDEAAWAMPGAPALVRGERLRDQLGCRRCHVTGGAGGTAAIALDRVAWSRDPAALRASILAPASFMPDFGLAPGQVSSLIAVLLRDADREAREQRYLVRFRAGAGERGTAFERHCGPCHRMLGAEGPLGVGGAGPNLTGLLGAHYPADGEPWTRERLERWIRNPRGGKPGTMMPPVPLEDAERRAVLDDFAPPAQRHVPNETNR